MLNNEKGSEPLYIQIKNILKYKLESEEYKEGDMLETELELQKKYHVSRITIRQAVNELASEGYLTRIRGKGTIVKYSKFTEKLSNILSFTDEMKMKGLIPYTRYAKVSIIRADKNIIKYLKVRPEDYVYKIERLRGANDIPFILLISYFTLHTKLPVDKEMYYDSLYKVIEESCGLVPVKAKDYFEAILADANLAEKFEIEIGSPILKRTRQSYDITGCILEYTVCYYRADKYKCSIEY